MTLLGQEIICGKVAFLGQSPAANLPFCNDISFFEKLADQGSVPLLTKPPSSNKFLESLSSTVKSVSMVTTSVLLVDVFEGNPVKLAALPAYPGLINAIAEIRSGRCLALGALGRRIF